MALTTYLLFDISIDAPVLGVLFFSTLLTYNLSAFSPFDKSSNNGRYGLSTLLVVGSLMGLLGMIGFLQGYQLVFLLHLGLISVFYTLPMRGLPWLQMPPLRRLPFLKIFLVAYVWASATVWLPLLGSDANFESGDNVEILVVLGQRKVWELFVLRFIWIFAITLPFDMRDSASDSASNIKTWANQIGLRKTWYVALSLLVFVWVATLWGEKGSGASLLAYTYMLLAVWGSYKRQSMLYYHFVLDGSMIVYSLCLLLGMMAK
jgi:4-hydroxybenzoate polyprenyltransferase